MQRRDFSQPVRRESPYYTIAEQSEPKKSTADLAAEIYRIQKLQRRHQLKIFFIVFLLLAILAVAAYIGMSAFSARKTRDLLPTTIYSQVDFPVLLPIDENIDIDKSSATVSGDILTFRITLNDEQVVITEQLKNPDFQPSDFTTSKDLSNVSQFTTPYGSGILAKANGRRIAILGAEKTLINIVQANSDSSSDLLPVLHALKQVN